MTQDNLGIATEAARRRKLYGDYAYAPPDYSRARIHHISVNLKAGTREVRTIVVVKPAPPKPAPPIIVAPIVTVFRRKRMQGNDLPRRVRDVLETACEVFEVEPWELLSRDRSQHCSRPRFACWRVLKKVLRFSQPRIGRIFTRDHTSCLSGLRRHADLIATNLHYRAQYRAMLLRLRKKRAAGWATR